MSHRLQVLIPSELDAQLRKSSQRLGISTGEFVRQALRKSISHQTSDDRQDDPVAKLAALSAPTGDIDQMLAEIEQGRF
jgi:metal-responsive CopG/Arc/MetJ family transcriptional regulator